MPTIDDKGFSCNPVATVARSLGLLIDIPSGERDVKGKLSGGSINRREKARPIDLAERQKTRIFPGKGGRSL